MTPKIIYLDQNKWIELAKANLNSCTSEDLRAILVKCKDLTGCGKAIFPLAWTHFVETGNSGDWSRRRNLADIMIELSNGHTILPQSQLTFLEMENVISAEFGCNVDRENFAVIGKGIGFAFGKNINDFPSGHLNPNAKVAFNDYLNSPELMRLVLMGVDESNRQITKTMIRDLAKNHASLYELVREKMVNMTDSSRKDMVIADLVYCLRNELNLILDKLDLSINDFFKLGKEKILEIFRNIPTLHVEVELSLERNKHWNRKIDPNDTRDISMLSVAIPYCDVVITESFWSNVVQRKGLDVEYKTVISKKLEAINNI